MVRLDDSNLFSIAEAADLLGLSPRTVKRHLLSKRTEIPQDCFFRTSGDIGHYRVNMRALRIVFPEKIPKDTIYSSIKTLENDIEEINSKLDNMEIRMVNMMRTMKIMGKFVRC